MRTVSLISDSPSPCGVESFQRRLAATLAQDEPNRHDACAIVGQPGESAVLARVLADRDAVIVSLPVVAWKKRIVAPARAMMAARRLGKAVVLILHEWRDLDWRRRATYLAYVPLATHVLFSSPVVRDQFAADWISTLVTRRRSLVPVPPNIDRPADVPQTDLSRRMAALRAEGRLVIGHFGSIYPRKQSIEVLDIVARLKALGRPAHGLFIGSFIKASDDVEGQFMARRSALGLDDDVTVSGYIGPPAEVFAALGAADVLVYMFAEGLTSRRSSVLTCLLTDRPVLVNAPAHDDEFAHHPSFRAALTRHRLALLPRNATPTDFAEAILAAPAAGPPAITFATAWFDAADAVRGVLSEQAGRRT